MTTTYRRSLGASLERVASPQQQRKDESISRRTAAAASVDPNSAPISMQLDTFIAISERCRRRQLEVFVQQLDRLDRSVGLILELLFCPTASPKQELLPLRGRGVPPPLEKLQCAIAFYRGRRSVAEELLRRNPPADRHHPHYHERDEAHSMEAEVQDLMLQGRNAYAAADARRRKGGLSPVRSSSNGATTANRAVHRYQDVFANDQEDTHPIRLAPSSNSLVDTPHTTTTSRQPGQAAGGGGDDTSRVPQYSFLNDWLQRQRGTAVAAPAPSATSDVRRTSSTAVTLHPTAPTPRAATSLRDAVSGAAKTSVVYDRLPNPSRDHYGELIEATSSYPPPPKKDHCCLELDMWAARCILDDALANISLLEEDEAYALEVIGRNRQDCEEVRARGVLEAMFFASWPLHHSARTVCQDVLRLEVDKMNSARQSKSLEEQCRLLQVTAERHKTESMSDKRKTILEVEALVHRERQKTEQFVKEALETALHSVVESEERARESIMQWQTELFLASFTVLVPPSSTAAASGGAFASKSPATAVNAVASTTVTSLIAAALGYGGSPSNPSGQGRPPLRTLDQLVADLRKGGAGEGSRSTTTATTTSRSLSSAVSCLPVLGLLYQLEQQTSLKREMEAKRASRRHTMSMTNEGGFGAAATGRWLTLDEERRYGNDTSKQWEWQQSMVHMLLMALEDSERVRILSEENDRLAMERSTWTELAAHYAHARTLAAKDALVASLRMDLAAFRSQHAVAHTLQTEPLSNSLNGSAAIAAWTRSLSEAPAELEKQSSPLSANLDVKNPDLNQSTHSASPLTLPLGRQERSSSIVSSTMSVARREEPRASHRVSVTSAPLSNHDSQYFSHRKLDTLRLPSTDYPSIHVVLEMTAALEDIERGELKKEERGLRKAIVQSFFQS